MKDLAMSMCWLAPRLGHFIGTLCCLLALAACGGGGGESGQPAPIADGGAYFPLAVGDRWINQSEGVRSETRVVETRSTALGTGHVLRTQRPGEVARDRVLVKSSDGVRTVPQPTDDFITQAIGPVQLMRFPLRVGSSHTAADVSTNSLFDFDGDGRVDPAAVRIEVTVVAVGPLTTAAGAFNDTVQLRTVITQSTTLSGNGQRLSTTTQVDEWYGRNIGLLRTVLIYDPGMPQASRIEDNLQGWRVGSNSSDTVPPSVAARWPSPGSIVRAATISVGFSEAMDRASLGGSGLRVQLADGTPVVGITEWVDDSTVRFVPAAGPLPSGAYTVSLAQAPEDILGNPLAGTASFGFTLDSLGPTLVSTSPVAEAVDVALDQRITLAFDEALLPASVSGVTLKLDNIVVATAVVANGHALTLTPAVPLQRGLTYEVSVDSSLTDTLGNPAAPTTLRFTTDPGRWALPVSQGAEQVAGLALADIDGDGVQDLLRSTYSNGGAGLTWSAWRRSVNGSRIGASWQTLVSGLSPTLEFAMLPGSFGVGDLDLNGRPDLVYTDSGGLGWFAQNTDGSWTQAGILPSFVLGMQVLPTSPSGGRSAIAYYGSLMVQPGLRILRSLGSYGTPGELISAGSGFQGGIRSGDFNSDGRTDLVTVSASEASGVTSFRLVVALQGADGSFTLREQALAAAVSLDQVADMDGDGRVDLVVFVGQDAMPSLMRQLPSGAFDAPSRLSLLAAPRSLQVADIDGDGRLDLVYLHDAAGPRRLAWAKQAADGQFIDTTLLEMARQPDLAGVTRLLVVDVTGDGRLDLLAGNQLFVQRSVVAATASNLKQPRRAAFDRLPGARPR